MKRVSTGIPGLDNLMDGGIPEDSSVLLCGAPGTGKSIFGLQFLQEGIRKKEPGLYITIEEKPENLIEQAQQFGWNTNRIKFLKIPIDEVGMNIVSEIVKEAKKIKAKRIVIDSLSILAINAPMYKLPLKNAAKGKFEKFELQPSSVSGAEEVQQFIYLFVSRIADLDATTLFIADSPQIENYLTRDTVSEFAADGVIQLKLMSMGKTVVRTVEIKKMRKTKIQPGLNTIEITKTGLRVSKFDY